MGKAVYQGKPLRISEYICGVDVMGGDMGAKINKIERGHKYWGKLIAIAYVSTSEGEDRLLRIGAEVEDSLVELFGSDASGWAGKSITLCFDPEVRFKGRKVGGARVRTSGQAAPPHAEPDAAKSGKLTSQIMGVIGKAGSLDELTTISEKIKARSGDLTKTDIALIRREYKTRQDQVAAVPAEPDAVVGPEDPITGEVEKVDQETGEVTTGTAPQTEEMFTDPGSPSVKGAPPPVDDDIPDFGGPE